MSDDDTPDNVLRMPRIGSPPPPPVPPPPTLDEPPQAPDTAPGVVRISAFDAPAVPHAPSTTSSVPAALRSDGLTPAAPDPHGLPPRTGALSLAAILAIALAAFEGLQTWLQESGPRRAEAAKHEREMELLAAKARADATRLGAETDKENARSRRFPSSHDYGRSALGRGSGGAGRGGGIGPGRPGAGRTGPYNGSAHGRGNGSGSRGNGGAGRPGTGRNDSGTAGKGTGSGRNSGPLGRDGARGSRNGGSPDRNGSPRGRNDGTGSGGGGRGRRSARQTVADWWGKGKKPADSGRSGGAVAGKGRSPKSPSGGADRKAAIRDAVKAARSGPTVWDSIGDRIKDRWKPRHTTTGGGRDTTGGKTKGQPGNDGWTPPGDRTTFREAAFKTMSDRWKKRRERWDATGGPRYKPRPRRNPGASHGPTTKPGPSAGPPPGGPGSSPGGRGPSPGPGYGDARSSPFDADNGPAVKITVEQVDPPGTHAKRWEPAAIGPRQQALPKQGAPALPRAPQRPAGQRPGTTRRKEPIPMPPALARTAGAPAPVAATVPAPGGLAPQHATDINLDKALKALTALTTAGMETHDECAQLAKQARKLLGELESMAQDLAVTHNVRGPRTLRAVAVLMESVAQLVAGAERMARASLDAAELAEAEEAEMARDYRPVQDATADAGLATPSARIHNEN
ncbi:hypothetical protein [Streptomyces cadmiisoli]|uniref:hypothetical protein n=1 Tax=Streptomyces cadmiisoli TaxID=2184053 RepID=UPI0036485091